MGGWLLALSLSKTNETHPAASGHDAVLLARENYAIREATATLEGRSLGDPTVLDENPTIGDVALPAVPSFIFGQAHAKIADPEAYEATRERVRGR